MSLDGEQKLIRHSLVRGVGVGGGGHIRNRADGGVELINEGCAFVFVANVNVTAQSRSVSLGGKHPNGVKSRV